MAAPSNNKSPTNGGVEASVVSNKVNNVNVNVNANNNIKDENSIDAARNKDTESVFSSLLTYESAEASDEYKSAKSLLNAGDFEQALASIEQAIVKFTKLVQEACSSKSSSSNNNNMMNTAGEDATVHPCLAPFHYLYGTTLLYSVEESSSSDTEHVTVSNTCISADAPVAAAAAAAFAVPQSEENEHPQQEQQEAEQDLVDNNNAEDLQIAFENLDLSRVLLEKHIAAVHGTHSAADNGDETSRNKKKLDLDLAQILLRLGDLNRLNGIYDQAAADYAKCLELRTAYISNTSTFSFKNDNNDNKYNRHICETHYNLALTYSLWVASDCQLRQDEKGEQEHDSNEQKQQQYSPRPTREELQEYRRRSLYHFLQCAKLLAAQIWLLTESTADDNDTAAVDQWLETALAVNLPGGKSTGHDNDTTEDKLHQMTSIQIQSLRRHVQATCLGGGRPNKLDDKHLAAVTEWMQMLDDIQETVDELPNAEAGMQEMSALKSEITAQAAAESAQHDDNGDHVAATTAFGSATAMATSAAANTNLMVVRKKHKKRERDGNDETAAAAVAAKKPAPYVE